MTSPIWPVSSSSPLPGITSERLAGCIAHGEYVGDESAIARTLLESRDTGMLIIMGAGDIIHLTDKIITEGI